MNSPGESAFDRKRVVLLLAKYTGLFALARQLTAGKTRILAYHGIWLGEGQFGNFLYMSADKFARRMTLLREWGYPIVPLSRWAESGRCNTVITIDDGWYGTWAAMVPELEAHRYPATVYLTTYYNTRQVPVIDVALQYCFSLMPAIRATGLHLPRYGLGPVAMDTEQGRLEALQAALLVSASLEGDAARQDFLQAVCEGLGIDHDRMLAERWFHLMSPEEVGDAASRGVTFEAHTHHHRITHQGQACLTEEVQTNADCINALVGRPPEHFCYPSGRYSPDLWPVLEACHMATATTTDIGLVDSATPRFALPRILDGQDVSELEFQAEMSGFLELSRKVRRFRRG